MFDIHNLFLLTYTGTTVSVYIQPPKCHDKICPTARNIYVFRFCRKFGKFQEYENVKNKIYISRNIDREKIPKISKLCLH